MMLLATRAMHVATDRQVWTYEPDGWPLGVLTGYARDDGVVLEHMIVFPGAPPSTLVSMLAEGAETAWAHGYAFVIFGLPHAMPRRDQLVSLARSVGADVYAQDEQAAHFVLRRPT